MPRPRKPEAEKFVRVTSFLPPPDAAALLKEARAVGLEPGRLAAAILAKWVAGGRSRHLTRSFLLEIISGAAPHPVATRIEAARVLLDDLRGTGAKDRA